MTEIKTSSGFVCTINPEVLDDFELFDAIVALQNGDPLQCPIVVGKILGADKKRLYDHLRDENGRVPTLKVTQEITEILEGLNSKK